MSEGDSEIPENHPIFGDKGKTYCEKIIDDWIETLADNPQIIEQAIEDAKGVKEIAAELVAKRHGVSNLIRQMPTKELQSLVYPSIIASLQEIIAMMRMEDNDSADWWKESHIAAALIVSALLESE
jgi:hypothetical protein